MKNRYDLTEGSILRKLLLVAVPIMGSQFMQMIYNLTDMFWLGQLSDSTMAVAASGIGGMFLWLSQAPLLFGRMGAEIGVSQSLGRGERRTAQDYAENAATLSIALGLLYGFVMVAFAEPLIALFGIRETDVIQNAALYVRITGAGIPFTFLSAAITGAFNGAGNSRLSFIANATGIAFNLVFDPLMIFVWNWGVMGAALSTTLGQAIVCAVFVILSRAPKTRIFEHFRPIARFDRAITGQIARWSAPVAAESGAFTLLAMAVTRLNATFGQEAIAVQRIGGQIESLSWLIGGGFGTAVTSFVGQNFGAGKHARIREGFRISMWLMTAWGLIITVLMYLWGSALFGLFSRDAAVFGLGGEFLKLLAIGQLPMCLECACSGAFRGAGKTLPSSVVSIASNVLRVPLVYLLVGLGFGIRGIWLGVVATATLRSLSICVWYAMYARRQRLEAG